MRFHGPGFFRCAIRQKPPRELVTKLVTSVAVSRSGHFGGLSPVRLYRSLVGRHRRIDIAGPNSSGARGRGGVRMSVKEEDVRTTIGKSRWMA